MKISVFGLGYVGTVSAACFAYMGHKVIGVDISEDKVNAITNGRSPIKETGLNRLIAQGRLSGNLTATTDVKHAIQNSDISFICVGTPPKQNGDIDLSALKKVCSDIGKALENKESYHTIVIRSTTFPGTLIDIIDVLEKSSRKQYGWNFDVAINPEFLREGSAIKDFFNPPFIIVGANSKFIGNDVFKCYEDINGKPIDSKRYLVKEETAQMIKYANNSWHALKVSFTNEIAAVCKKVGVDSKKLMGLFCEDDDLNLSSYYMKPGFAYGGSCLPKDLACIKNKAKQLKINCPILNSISPSNMEQINRAVDLIESTGKKKIGILGITFKADSDDIRGNPILLVINKLLNKGYNIKIWDKMIGKEDLQNISKSYRKEVYDLVNLENLKEKVEDISKLFVDVDQMSKQDIIVVSNRDKSLRRYLPNLLQNKIIIDLQNIFDDSAFLSERRTL